MKKGWKSILNFSKYECNVDGTIRNLKTKYILKQSKTTEGYNKVFMINDEGLGKKVYVHRAIASTWIENKENKPTVHHINYIRDDNRVSNLSWATHSEQSHLRNYSSKKNSFYGRILMCDKLSGKEIRSFDSLKQASEYLQIPNSYKKISKCISKWKDRNGYVRKSAYGYIWKKDDIIDMDGEIWKDISCINNSFGYKVSNYGRVINKIGRICVDTYNSGYKVVYINKKCIRIHRLVAMEFIPRMDLSKDQVNHIDGDKNNNRFSNLEWVNQRENSKHAIENGLVKLKKVVLFDSNKNILNEFSCPREASESLNIKVSSIYRMCSGYTENKVSEDIYIKYL